MPEPRVHRAAALVVVAVALTGCGEQPEPRQPPRASTPAASAAPADPSPTTSSPTPTYEPEPFVPAAYDEWLTEIPDENRSGLDVALPPDSGDFTRGRAGVGFAFCDEEAFSSTRVTDRATVSVSGPEYGQGRDLRLFADDRAADRLLRRIARVVSDCAEQESGGTSWRSELRASRLEADASFTVVQSYFTADGLPVLGASFWEVVRVGNAVLLAERSGEYEPTTSLDPGIREHAADLAPVIEEMRVFGADATTR